MERQRRSFTEEYNRQAVEFVSGGRSVTSGAKELGPRDSVLRRWLERLGPERRGPRGFPQCKRRRRRRTRLRRSPGFARRTGACAWSATV
ncbi:transposase [Bradyrhizobium yuanmingense]|uniref:transposase n=1 Tax=Bradyrhizobium yuanmingense TaxID=108015 RepID=UPI0030B8D264